MVDVGFAAGARRGELVDAKPGDDGGEVGLGRLDGGMVGLLPAQVRILDYVLGVSHAARHAVGDREEQGTYGGEDAGWAFGHDSPACGDGRRKLEV